MTDSQTTIGVGENYDDWNTPQVGRLSESFNSVNSDEDFGLEPLPMGNMVGRSVPSYIESSFNGNSSNIMMAPDNNVNMNPNNNVYNNNPNNGMHNKKLQDIWMKNRQLEDSINKLKKELSTTNFSLGNDCNDMNGNGNNNHESSSSNSKFLVAPFPAGPSIDRMQQLHRRRLLMGDNLPPQPIGNDQNQQNHQGMNANSNQNNFNVIEEALGMDNDMLMDPFDMNPVPFEEVFNATGAEANMKKKELITNLNHLDFFGTNC